MNDFSALFLHQSPHDVNSGIMPVKQGRSGYETQRSLLLLLNGLENFLGPDHHADRPPQLWRKPDFSQWCRLRRPAWDHFVGGSPEETRFT
ncbi:MAG: hypothetical protein VX663_09030 [Pseudomonadota bacterium]|nr:hypothetical protein [Pseudomonadota bacterium]